MEKDLSKMYKDKKQESVNNLKDRVSAKALHGAGRGHGYHHAVRHYGSCFWLDTNHAPYFQLCDTVLCPYRDWDDASYIHGGCSGVVCGRYC